MKYRDLIRLLIDNGFSLKRNNSHQIWCNELTSVAIPYRRGDVNKMLAIKILKQAGLYEKYNEK